MTDMLSDSKQGEFPNLTDEKIKEELERLGKKRGEK